MICKNCGKKLQNSTDVCPECGESLRPNVSQANVKSVILKVETDDTIIWCLKKKALYTAAVVLVILVVVLNLLMAMLSFFNRIDFTKYVLVEVTGYDDRGSLDVQIDSEGLSNKLFDKVPDELGDKERQKLSAVINLLQSGIEIKRMASNYSNGDELVLRITNLEALSKAADQKCNSRDQITYTVKDLQEASVLTFDNLFDVSFTGFNGAGCVLVSPKLTDAPWDISYYHNKVYIDTYTYNIYCQEGEVGALSNEDTISIGLTAERKDNSDYLLDAYGMCVRQGGQLYGIRPVRSPEH